FGSDGIVINASSNLIEGNYIGTNLTGTVALSNNGDGVAIGFGTTANTIGGSTSASNLISGNGGNGVFIDGANSNLVAGNFIGTDLHGTKTLGNFDGVVIDGGATDNTIGGTTAGARNLISGNIGMILGPTGDQVLITDAGTSANLVAGNFIGTDVN